MSTPPTTPVIGAGRGRLMQAAASSSSKLTLQQSKDHVGAIRVKLPPFWPSDPELWFAQAEGQFEAAAITTEQTKFIYMQSSLDQEDAREVRDIILSPPNFNPYTHLKTELIARLGASSQQRIRRLLTDEQLGDQAPSQLFRKMQQLAGTTPPDASLMRQLFLQCLPMSVGVIVATLPDSITLEEVAAMADRILETTHLSVQSIQATTTPTLDATIAALTAQVSQLNERVIALAPSRLSDSGGY